MDVEVIPAELALDSVSVALGFFACLSDNWGSNNF